MPGNEVGERVHNFFPQENLSQGQHHSQVVDGSWPVLGDKLWAGSQRNIGSPSSNSKNYNLQPSDIKRGHSNHSFPVLHGLNFSQSTPRHELTKSQNLNGYVHGLQVLQTRQNESNFLGVDTESVRDNITPRGLSVYESRRGNGPESHTTSFGLESSESPVSFNFFGSQQQMSGQQTGMLQSLTRQQSEFHDMQLMQQQLMLRKMREFQRQQQIRQLEARQHISLNQIPSVTEQASGSHSSALLKGNSISPIPEASNCDWATEPTAGNTSWLQQAMSAFQGSTSGFTFSPGQGQSPSSINLVARPVDQSLYGVPISNIRGTPHQYSHSPLDKSPVQQMTMYSNSFTGNHCAGFPDQINMQDELLVSRQGFQGENLFGRSSSQGVKSGMNLESIQEVNVLQRNAPVQEFHERQEVASPSETLQANTEMQMPSSQNVVALDPTEEKILFGDENIWDAFGNSANMGAGSVNPLNVAGFLNGFPSVHSGSWSALMQSAVAESSSNDIGLQEEWSGLSSQNTEVPPGNCQPLTHEDHTKQRTLLGNNHLQVMSGLSSGSVRISDHAIVNNSYQSISGFQESGHKFSYEQGDRLQTDSTHRSSVPEPPEDRSKWLTRGPLKKPLCEATPIYGNTSHSLDAELNAKSISGSWAPQWSVSSYNAGQPQNKPNGSSVSETISPTEEAISKIHGNENILQHLQSNDQRRVMHEEMSHGGHIWRTDSGPNATAGLEHSSRVNRNDSSLINIAAIPNASISRASQKNSQLLPSSQHLNYWKYADSSMKSKGSVDSVLEKGPQVLESSVNNSDKGAVKMHGTENYDRKENSSDSHRSNLSQHATTGGSRENGWSDGSDSRGFSGGKQKLSGQAGRKIPGPQKFQYHPMGNLEEDEPSGAMKHATHSRLVSQQIPRASYSHNQGYVGQSIFFGQFPKPSTEMGKGHSPDLQGIRKGEGEMPSRGTLLGSAHNTSAPLDRSVNIYAPKKAVQSSQNMLELLHKVDQSKEHGSYDGSVEPLQHNQASASQCFGLQLAPPSQWLAVQNHALASQSSARSDCSLLSLSHTTPEIREKSHARLASTDQAQTLPSSHETSQGEVRTNKLGMTGQTGNDASQYGMRGSFSAALASSFSHSRSWVQNRHMIGLSDRDASHCQHSSDFASRALTGQSLPASLPQAAGIVRPDKPVCSGDASQPTDANYSLEGVSASQISVGQAGPFSQPSISSSISQQGDLPKILPNAWTNVPGQQYLFGAHPHKFSLSIFQRSQLNDDVVSTSSTPRDQDDQDARKDGIGPSEFGVDSMDSQGFAYGEVQQANESFHQRLSSGNNDSAEKMSVSRGLESVVQNLSDASPSNSALTQRDIEAFGHSLKPNNLSHQNCSLLHQMREIKKSTEIDPSDRAMKRLKGLDGGLGCQIAHKAGQSSENDIMVGDSSHCAAVPSGDSKMLRFTEPADNSRGNTSSQPGNVASQDVLAFGQKDSENYSYSNNTAFVGVEHSQISPQMAPCWFNQFGTFKNGQMLLMYDAQKNATIKTMEQQPFTLGKSSGTSSAHNSSEQVNAVAAADSDQVHNIWQRSKPTSFAIEDFSSTQSLAEDVSDQYLLTVRPKKRKNAASEPLPWQKEVTQGSLLLTISIAEVDWAKAANRLIDKLDDQAEMIEDRPTVVRPKRRLILTTQLMQPLFRPPLAAVLSADASSNYETVAYLVAKLALGDACSLIAYSGSDSCLPLESSNLSLSDKHKTSERTGDQHLSKVMEDFIGKARKLENDFLRLDKRALVMDLRIESQDLEKISVINRFARFHGRGQADVAEPSSIFDAATNSLRPGHQKYVTPHPMPRNLLDRVQCLSL